MKMPPYVSLPFTAASADVQIYGKLAFGFIQNVEKETIAPLAAAHGLTGMDEEQWYNLQQILDFVKEVGDLAGGDTAWVAMGKQSVANAKYPPEIDSVTSVLSLLPHIYHLNIKNCPIEEGWATEVLSDHLIHVYSNVPFPVYGIYGYIWGLVAHYKQPGDLFKVTIIENPKPETQPGTLFEIKWGKESDLR